MGRKDGERVGSGGPAIIYSRKEMVVALMKVVALGMDGRGQTPAVCMSTSRKGLAE